MDEVAPSQGNRFQPAAALSAGVKRPRCGILAWLAMALLIAVVAKGRSQEPGSRATPRPSEYEVKAAFLLNFTKFIDWPPSPHAPDTTFRICILGSDPFGTTLDQIVEGERVGSRRLAVQRVQEAANSCEVLFINKSADDIARTLAEVPRGVLTVGESHDFLRQGGMIAFVLENRRVRFDVNERAAARAGLKLSSKLLNVARSVEK